MMGYLYILIAIIGTASGQIFIKLAAQNMHNMSFKALISNKYLYAGFFAIMICPFFVNLALDDIDLSVVFAFSGVHFVTVPIGAKLFLKETITKNMYLGMGCIVVGVILFNL